MLQRSLFIINTSVTFAEMLVYRSCNLLVIMITLRIHNNKIITFLYITDLPTAPQSGLIRLLYQPSRG